MPFADFEAARLALQVHQACAQRIPGPADAAHAFVDVVRQQAEQHAVEIVDVPPAVHVRLAEPERTLRENAAEEACIVHARIPGRGATGARVVETQARVLEQAFDTPAERMRRHGGRRGDPRRLSRRGTRPGTRAPRAAAALRRARRRSACHRHTARPGRAGTRSATRAILPSAADHAVRTGERPRLRLGAVVDHLAGVLEHVGAFCGGHVVGVDALRQRGVQLLAHEIGHRLPALRLGHQFVGTSASRRCCGNQTKRAISGAPCAPPV